VLLSSHSGSISGVDLIIIKAAAKGAKAPGGGGCGGQAGETLGSDMAKADARPCRDGWRQCRADDWVMLRGAQLPAR